MKHAAPKKPLMDWYFPRVNGKVVLALSQNIERRKKAESMGLPREPKRNSFFGFALAVFFFLGVAVCPVLAAETKAPAAGMTSTAKRPLTTAAKIKAAKEEERKKKEKRIEKALSGTVAFIRKNRMSIEFSADDDAAEEMIFNVDSKVKVDRVKKFSDIGQGDLVEVKYVQTYLEPEMKGAHTTVLSNVVTSVTLVKKAKKATDLVADEATRS